MSLEFKTRQPPAIPRQQRAGHTFASQSPAKLLIPAAKQLTLHSVTAPILSLEPGFLSLVRANTQSQAKSGSASLQLNCFIAFLLPPLLPCGWSLHTEWAESAGGLGKKPDQSHNCASWSLKQDTSEGLLLATVRDHSWGKKTKLWPGLPKKQSFWMP